MVDADERVGFSWRDGSMIVEGALRETLLPEPVHDLLGWSGRSHRAGGADASGRVGRTSVDVGRSEDWVGGRRSSGS